MPIFNPSKILTQVILIQKYLKSNENCSNYVRTPSTHDRATRFIKKSIKHSGKIQVLKFSKTRDLYVSPLCLSECTGWRPWLENGLQECQKITWPTSMHIFNEVWCSYPIPSKIFTQVIHIQKNLSPMKGIQVIIRIPTVDGRTDGQTDGRTNRWIKYTPSSTSLHGVWIEAHAAITNELEESKEKA